MKTLVITGDMHGRVLFESITKPKVLLNSNEYFDIQISVNNSFWEAVLLQNDNTIELQDVSNVYVRRPASSDDIKKLPSHAQDFIVREFQEIISFLAALPGYRKSGVLYCQGKQFNLGANKIIQLIAASELGIKVPETIVTNIPHYAKSFYDDMNENIIYKCLSTPIVDYSDGKRSMIYTSAVPNNDFSNVCNCPCLFQRNIIKSKELRIAVIGTKTIATQIDSQKSDLTRQDWRTGMENKEMYSLVELPDSVSEALVKLHQALDLDWGMADMIISSSGEYIFLETNPDGAWLWLEEILPSLKVTDFLADYISNHRTK